ncbi:ACYL-COA-BINDING DOMAIN PROTEIN [Salix purpurea]|uniref:ACYL-COA-BINDING DOMAIN PROTEIN n=1 Tax=Salix purpurea TaxID=77065 RepID=A0A9Q0T3I1_SALPP|nr:ACYL-COA-BINDING DOMAIN PROTEIN [Salix purpurea]
MGGERKKVFVGLMVAMILGFAVYFRLWTIDYAISSDDTELIRRQFDLANREASDESAEWRMKYDEEVERAAKCDKQLVEVCMLLSLLICLLFLAVLHTLSL